MFFWPGTTHKIIMASVLILAGACASTPSYLGWQALRMSSDFSGWAGCMEDQSVLWWSRNDPMFPDQRADPQVTPDQAFAAMLDRCEAQNRTAAWDALSEEERRRMIEEARRNFFDIDNQRQAAREASIT